MSKSVNLYVVVPCYNEEAVLHETSKQMLELFGEMKNDGLINDNSRIVLGYESAGTIEFLLNQSGEFYFMEMNTRIQVEHPVTEFVSGVDLIKEQICIAAGEPLSVQQKDIEIRGHAMECRINAEDPERHFMPCPGKITDLHLPGGNGIRVDTAVYNDYAIPPYYDSMIAKIIVYDKDRRSAIRKMISALGEVAIEGVKTNVDFLYELLNQPDFQEGNITTDFIPQHYPDL